MMYEDQELRTSNDHLKNWAIIDVDDEDEFNALLNSDEDTPGPSTRTVFCKDEKVWRAEVKVNLDIKTRVQTFRGKARFKNAIRDLKWKFNLTKMSDTIVAGTILHTKIYPPLVCENSYVLRSLFIV
jgi:hypothetical protein